MALHPGASALHLPEHHCWALLRASAVGRLAVVLDGRPEIFPVNHVVDRGTVVIRTGPGSKLAGAAHRAPVAFEVDGYDAPTGQAWSVVLHGRVEMRQTVQEMVDTAALPLFPWHADPKPCVVRVVPDDVSGRRFTAVAPSHWAAAGVAPAST